MRAKLLLAATLLVGLASFAVAQNSNNYRTLDFYAVTVGGTPKSAVTGPANGCQISSAVDLIIDSVAAAGTTRATTSQLLAAGGLFQCGPISSSIVISVNCSGGGTCSWQGVRW